MEKRGLGTKATRHAIIDRLYQVGYAVNDPVEPTCLGRAVVDALSAFAPRITTPDMTAELEAEMDAIANGRSERAEVVEHSRALLAAVMGQLIDKATEVGDALKEATAEDSRVGTCPKSGHDLLVKHSKTGQFVGCSGWPDCDVTYPLPKGKIESLGQVCETCGAPRIKVVQFRSKPIERCVNPQCETNAEPEIDIGACPACSAGGRDRRARDRAAQPQDPQALRPLHQLRGLPDVLPAAAERRDQPTGESCATCGSPEIVVQTRRAPGASASTRSARPRPRTPRRRPPRGLRRERRSRGRRGVLRAPAPSAPRAARRQAASRRRRATRARAT